VILPSDVPTVKWYAWSPFVGVGEVDGVQLPVRYEDIFPESYRSITDKLPLDPAIEQVDTILDRARAGVLEQLVHRGVQLFYALLSPTTSEATCFAEQGLDIPQGWQAWDDGYLPVLLTANVDNLLITDADGRMLIVYETWDALYLSDRDLIPTSLRSPLIL
jgi:hypothetical protein